MFLSSSLQYAQFLLWWSYWLYLVISFRCNQGRQMHNIRNHQPAMTDVHTFVYTVLYTKWKRRYHPSSSPDTPTWHGLCCLQGPSVCGPLLSWYLLLLYDSCPSSVSKHALSIFLKLQTHLTPLRLFRTMNHTLHSMLKPCCHLLCFQRPSIGMCVFS